MAATPPPATALPAAPVSATSPQVDVVQSVDAISAHLQGIGEATNRLSLHVAEIAKYSQPKSEAFWNLQAGDLIQLLLLVVAIVALVFSATSTRQNSQAVTEAAKGRDTENYLKLFEKFNETWAKFTDVLGEATRRWAADTPKNAGTPTPADLHDAYPQFVELMNLFEAVCQMHNEELLPRVTARAMADYMKGMLPIVVDDPIAFAWIKQSSVSNDVYCEIKKFARLNSLALNI